MTDKERLKEELVDLRMKLAEAENQANRVKGLTSTKYWTFARSAYWHIISADDSLCELARKLGLDKLNVVEPEKANR